MGRLSGSKQSNWSKRLTASTLAPRKSSLKSLLGECGREETYVRAWSRGNKQQAARNILDFLERKRWKRRRQGRREVYANNSAPEGRWDTNRITGDLCHQFVVWRSTNLQDHGQVFPVYHDIIISRKIMFMPKSWATRIWWHPLSIPPASTTLIINCEVIKQRKDTVIRFEELLPRQQFCHDTTDRPHVRCDEVKPQHKQTRALDGAN